MKKISVFTLLFSILIGLGYWQLHRAHEKSKILNLFQQKLMVAPKSWHVNMPAIQYQNIILTGKYLPYTLFLDNQYYKHQFGFHVLNPLLLTNGTCILVDRGFIATSNRAILPKIFIPSGTITIRGSIYYPTKKNFILGNIIEKKSKNIFIVEQLDIQIINDILPIKMSDFILHLDPNITDHYIRQWIIVAMPPERHYAYALQWFAMAFVLIILYFKV